jgi:DNA-binding NtrC family response regulator
MTLESTLEATLERSDGTGGDLPRAAHLFLVLEAQRPGSSGVRFALDRVGRDPHVDLVTIGRGPTRGHTFESGPEGRILRVRVPDPRMSARHARIVREGSAFVLEDEGSTNGTRVDGERIGRVRLDDGALIELGSTSFVLRTALPTPPRDAAFVDGATLVGREPGLSTLMPEQARRIAGLARIAMSEVPILLLGESGSGKEVLARAIHAISGRRGAFVPVNCGALPETLVEAQLFGHGKGAFSGAVRDEPGLVRASDGGTLFLDEIGDLPRTSQAALLRVLQEREVLPVGATKPVRVDLRVVAATHRRVDQLQGGDGEFRADLYARLAGLTFDLLPLRERREDLGLLVAGILRKIAPARVDRLAFSAAFATALLRHDWPLNVRELAQALGVAIVLADEDPASTRAPEGEPVKTTLDLGHLPESVRRALQQEPTRTRTSAPAPAPAREDDPLRTSLLEALRATRGNVSEVARTMGKTRMQIHRWMKRFGIDPESFRGP